jgi:hypothetical protein
MPPRQPTRRCLQWINNCVGHNNHRYFFLFMAFVWVGCLYIASITASLFFAVRVRVGV